MEKALVQAQDGQDPSLPTRSVLLALPETPLAHSAGQDGGNINVFKNFRRLGLAYLDENGERLTFSVGTATGGGGHRQAQSKEVQAITPECSDSEGDAAGTQREWFEQDSGLRNYWPYPSKAVSGSLC